MFRLIDLPYQEDAFEPHLSARTLKCHHQGHHAAYVRNLNDLVKGNPVYEGRSLKDVILLSHERAEHKIFNNSAQIWNHDFYWNSLSPIDTDHELDGGLKVALESSFTDVQGFTQAFCQAAVGQFGSGWCWLVVNSQNHLEIQCTSNADVPFLRGSHPILVMDVWEHAYYLDYQQKRADYLQSMMRFLNWSWAAKCFNLWTQGK